MPTPQATRDNLTWGFAAINAAAVDDHDGLTSLLNAMLTGTQEDKLMNLLGVIQAGSVYVNLMAESMGVTTEVLTQEIGSLASAWEARGSIGDGI